MDGSRPAKVIDLEMVREHGGDVEDLARRIREIGAEALAQQTRLSQRSPMPRPHAKHWWTRSA